MATKKQFIREYVKAIRNGNAAVFGGAGLSRASGYVVWKELLRPLAEDISIKIDEEHDLTEIAQYVKNKSGNRASINTTIIEAFSKDVNSNENVDILTRLPIYTYWTTNYDCLIEEGLRTANRNADVKIDFKQLSSTKRDRDAIVYKMHGDVNHPADAVLTKDDYVQYDRKHPLFRNVLQGDLISKTFLFIGFSFEDPNIDSVFGQIRLLLDENIRNHFCIMKNVVKDECKNDEDFGYKKARQDLWEQDLSRYGIQTVFVDDYSEITDILKQIEEAVLANNVFISGSIEFFENGWTKELVGDFVYKLSKRLVENNYKVTSGYGFGIGSWVINGALDEIYHSHFRHIDEHLCLRPFPQGIKDSDDRKRQWKKYRECIIEENGVAIFLFGNKKDSDGNKADATGCLEEYEIARDMKRVIIPVGCTGDVAAKIFTFVEEDHRKGEYRYLDDYISILKEEMDVDKLIDSILAILNSQRIA
ncbi:MAG: SIR2 family protein [Clostridiales bacterium]|nr:SIR2 family protein [Clostridiales bacterium]